MGVDRGSRGWDSAYFLSCFLFGREMAGKGVNQQRRCTISWDIFEYGLDGGFKFFLLVLI